MPKANLTDRTLASLSKTGGQVDHYDTNVTGLIARPKPHGGVTFNFRYSIAGQKRRLTIGDWPAVSLAEARRKALGYRKAIADGLDPWGEANKAKRAETVAEAVDEYVTTHLQKNLKAWELPAGTLRGKLVPALGHKKLADVTRAEVRAEAVKLAKTAPVYANRFLSHMSAFFAWAIRNDVGGMGERANPASFIDKPGGEESPKERALSADEIAALWPHLLAEKGPFGFAARLILATGQRPGEVCGMTAEEVDLKAGLWVIPATRMKNGRQHIVPIVGQARDIIAELIAVRGSGSLFIGTTTRRPISTENLWHGLKRLARSAGIDPVSAHDLRRTAISHMARLGVDPLHIGHVASHTSVTAGTITTQVYVTHDYLPEKRAALTRWDAELRGIVAIDPPTNVVDFGTIRAAS